MLEVYTTEEVLRLKIPVTELSEVELLREIHLLEEQDEVLWTAWSQTVKPIADNEVVTPVPVPGNVILWEKWKQNRESAAALWDAFGTLKHGISRGDIVVCRGVRYIALEFIFDDSRIGEPKPKCRLRAIEESDTGVHKRIYDQGRRWHTLQQEKQESKGSVS